MKLFLCIIGLASALADNELFKFANDRFTSKMFQEVMRSNRGNGFVLSGFSVLPPLAQLALASTGSSHYELLSAIGFPDDDTTINVFSNLNQQINNLKRVSLHTASRIYIATDAKLNKDFAAKSQSVFGSDFKNIDFSNREQSARSINFWVELQTMDKIKNLIPPSSLSESTRSVLVNAIYFKGTWLNKFNTNYTRNADFHLSKYKTVSVPTMIQYVYNGITYGESAELGAKLLELPYEGGEASFLIVLPNEIDGLANVIKKLENPSVLNKAIGEMTNQTFALSMPKFNIETKIDLKMVLQKMKVNKIWNPDEAHLDKLLENEPNMSLSSATQKAFIKVTEHGTEAAVANDFPGVGSAWKLKTINVDRPFYFENLRHVL